MGVIKEVRIGKVRSYFVYVCVAYSRKGGSLDDTSSRMTHTARLFPVLERFRVSVLGVGGGWWGGGGV